MHAAGIIHRDVKPSNILRLRDRWLIGDLGVARLDDEAALTQTGARIGTPQYWAPETARGEECTPAVDVYGLGCVLYEALTGQKLFAGGSPVATGSCTPRRPHLRCRRTSSERIPNWRH